MMYVITFSKHHLNGKGEGGFSIIEDCPDDLNAINEYASRRYDGYEEVMSADDFVKKYPMSGAHPFETLSFF